MDIRNVGNSSAVGAVGNVLPNPSRTPSSIPPAPGGAPAQAHISRPGQAFGRLQQLSQQDPAEFKAVTQQISDQLHQLAQNETGAAADRANQLADRFAQASQTGDMSSFAPSQEGAQGAQGHHHHHGHGGGGGGGGAIADVISNALAQVNQTLSASASGSSASSTTSDGSSG
jgi:hypothetical protein